MMGMIIIEPGADQPRTLGLVWSSLDMRCSVLIRVRDPVVAT